MVININSRFLVVVVLILLIIIVITIILCSHVENKVAFE